MGLAEADSAIQEERVVGVARTLGDRQACRVSEAIGRADDEIREGVARIDVGRPAFAAHPGGLHADGRRGGLRAGCRAIRLAGGGRDPICALDRELDLDAVADDPGEGLADQRAIPGLEPVLGESIGDGDPEPLVVDVDKLRVAKPRLEIGGRKRYLQLSEGSAPDLLGIHMV